MEKCPSIKNIALILDTADEVQRNMIHGIIRESRRGDPWNLMIANPRMSSPSAVFGSGNTPAGIIAKVATLKTSSWLANTGLPAVLLDPPDSENEVGAPLHKFPRVLCDSEAVGLKMANCFILNGFKNFAFYGPQDEGNWCKWRRMAFQKEVRRIGASCLLYREAPHPPAASRSGNPWPSGFSAFQSRSPFSLRTTIGDGDLSTCATLRASQSPKRSRSPA